MIAYLLILYLAFLVSTVVSYYFLFINFSFVEKHPFISLFIFFICTLVTLYSLFIFSSLFVNNVYKIIKVLKHIYSTYKMDNRPEEGPSNGNTGPEGGGPGGGGPQGGPENGSGIQGLNNNE